MTDTNTTNGNGATKKPTKVAELVKKHKEAGVKLNAKAAKDLLDAFKKGLEARDKAEKALADATKAMSDNAEALVLAFGDKKIAVGDRVFFAASRGDTVFYRELSKQDEESIVRA